MTDEFIHEHPWLTVAAALGVGLLGPLGVRMLAQQSTAWREGLDWSLEDGVGGSDDPEFIYRHPFITIGVALGAVLLTPAGVQLVDQLQDGWPDIAAALEKLRGDWNAAEGEDFMHQHPFATVGAALGIGLLAPLALQLLGGWQTAAGIDDEGAGLDRTLPPERRAVPSPDAQPGDPDAAAAEELAQRRALLMRFAALGLGLFGALQLLSRRTRGDATQDGAPASASRRRAAKSAGVKHDVGALDWQFATHRADGKDVTVRFAWKKRPADAADDDWPTDHMGFAVDRPDGKQTTFKMTRRSRPVPDGYGDTIRPGLGEARLEFVSNQPNARTLRFTWEKIPPAAPPAEAAADPDPGERPDAPGITPRVRGRPAAGSGSR